MSGLLHLFEQCGAKFLFLPRSSRLYELSDAAAAVAALPFGDDETAALPAPKATPLPAEEELALHDELRDLIRQEGTPSPNDYPPETGWEPYHTFSIYIAQACNMTCSYCWNRGGSFGNSPHLMALEDAAAATSLIVSLLECSTAEKICINFYGGEPLLNFPVLKKITLDLLEWEDRLGTSLEFTLDTNGVLLEGEPAQFLARHFAHVGVSLDGREAVHDVQRPGESGEATWQRIAGNIASFPNQAILGLRGTLTRSSDSYLETFRQLTGLGVRRIQLEYCHEPGYDHDAGYPELTVPLERQLAELREFAKYYIETISRYHHRNDIPFLSNLLDEIRRLKDGYRAARPCGAGRNTLAINSRGELFPCIAFVHHDRFRMEQNSLYQTLKELESDRQNHCRECWLRYDCAGGCYATRIDGAGNVRLPHPDYCLAMRAKAEVYLYALSQMMKKCPWHLSP